MQSFSPFFLPVQTIQCHRNYLPSTLNYTTLNLLTCAFCSDPVALAKLCTKSVPEMINIHNFCSNKALSSLKYWTLTSQLPLPTPNLCHIGSSNFLVSLGGLLVIPVFAPMASRGWDYPLAFAYQSGSWVSFSFASAVIISKAGWVVSQARSPKGVVRIFSTSFAASAKYEP